MFIRKETRQISVGGVKIGGNAPVVVQSMCKTDTRDTFSTLAQIKQLEKVGCQIVRLAIPDQLAGEAFKEIAKRSSLPLVADIHFDYKLALQAIQSGASKIRFNPGNIGEKENLLELVQACKKYKLPIRIGVNSGSIEKRFSSPTPEALAESALHHTKILEEVDFRDICLSVKSSSVVDTLEANRLLSQKSDYPLHIGLTEAGLPENGIIKSSVAIGALLSEGIGDTVRVSLTANPAEEVRVAQEILQSLKLGQKTREFISCPGCGRTEVDHSAIAREIFAQTKELNPNLTIAVMGCIVNGIGEASHADFALLGGRNNYAIYKKGELLKTLPEENVAEEFLKVINTFA